MLSSRSIYLFLKNSSLAHRSASQEVRTAVSDQRWVGCGTGVVQMRVENLLEEVERLLCGRVWQVGSSERESGLFCHSHAGRSLLLWNSAVRSSGCAPSTSRRMLLSTRIISYFILFYYYFQYYTVPPKNKAYFFTFIVFLFSYSWM